MRLVRRGRHLMVEAAEPLPPAVRERGSRDPRIDSSRWRGAPPAV